MKWENVLKKDIKELKKVAEELDKAVEMHRSQAERIRQHIKEMEDE
jgi:chaperonin cofactor prefoldin